MGPAAVALMVLAGASAAEEPITIELNKLEEAATKCRTYLVIGETAGQPLQSLKTDLIVFGKDGGIAKRLIAELGPVRGKKTTVRIFDVDVACGDISGVLLNDVESCAPASAEACLERLSVSSRLPVRFFK